MSFQTEHNLFTFKMQGTNFSANLKEFGLKTKKIITRGAAWSRYGVGQKKNYVGKIWVWFGILISCQNFQLTEIFLVFLGENLISIGSLKFI